MATRPQTFAELFDFYHKFVKLLYSSVQARNVLPAEVLFELNAALDHIARHWTYDEPEAKVVDKAYGHLKRSCLDIFKVRVAEAVDQFDELRQIDTSSIDGGSFDQRLHELIAKIKSGATEARQLEGDTRQEDQVVTAFEKWLPVFADCVALDKEFYNNAEVDWSKRRTRVRHRSKRLVLLLFLLGVVAGLLLPRLMHAFRH